MATKAFGNVSLTSVFAKHERHKFSKRFLADCRFLKSKRNIFVELDTPVFDRHNFVFEKLLESVNLDDETARYLKSDFSVCEALLFVISELKRYFDYTALALEKDDEDDLWLYVFVANSPKEALNRLWSFDKEWWLDNRQRITEKLHVDVVPLC